MTRRIFLCLALLVIFVGCSRKEDADSGKFSGRTTVGDDQGNGGFLRVQVEGKVWSDDFFVAQFTPRGDLFPKDNLQFFNYDVHSEKYPRLLISVDSLESDLEKWQGCVLPMDILVLTVEKGTPALQARGRLTITRITEQAIEGEFTGDLISTDGARTFPIHGEFRGIFRLNV